MSCRAYRAVDLAWEKVRRRSPYSHIVQYANEWLEVFWPLADQLGLAPTYAPGGARQMGPPKIIESTRLGSGMLGCYYPSCHYHGPLIKVPTADEMRKRKDPATPLLAELRKTILHEVTHSIQDRAGRLSRRIDNNREHDAHFWKRLGEYERLFPVTTLGANSRGR